MYTGSLTDRGIALNLKKLKEAFPRQTVGFFDILTERLIANGFTDERLSDAVNNVIDNFQYKEINISDIVKFDRKKRLYSYKEACAMVTEGKATFGEDLNRVEMGDKVYWVKKDEVL